MRSTSKKRVGTCGRGPLADFLLLFLEACLLFMIAHLLSDARSAAWALIVLLALDAVWGMAVYLLFVKTRTRWAEIRWVWINAVAVPVLAVALLATSRAANEAALAALIIAIGAVLRTIVDYWRSWRFYFPA